LRKKYASIVVALRNVAAAVAKSVAYFLRLRYVALRYVALQNAGKRALDALGLTTTLASHNIVNISLPSTHALQRENVDYSTLYYTVLRT